MYKLYIENKNNNYIKIDTFKNKEKAIIVLNYFRKLNLGGYIEKQYKN